MDGGDRREGDVAVMISGTQIGQVLKVYRSKGNFRIASKSQAAGGVLSKDDVSISASPKDIERIKELVAKSPDIRYEKVESIARKLQAGTYKVDPSDVADKMLGRLLADKIR